MEEADGGGERRSRFLVDEREAGSARSRELGADVRGLEAHVVQPLAALLEKLGDPPVGVDRLQELDLAAPDGKQRRLDALVQHGGLLRNVKPEPVTPERQTILEAPHHEADVMHAGQHGRGVSTRRFPRLQGDAAPRMPWQIGSPAFAAPALPAAARRSLHPPNTTRSPILPTRDEVSGRLEREAAEADRDAGGADHEQHASPPLETPGLARDAQTERKRGRHGVAVLAVRGKEAVLHAETAR